MLLQNWGRGHDQASDLLIFSPIFITTNIDTLPESRFPLALQILISIFQYPIYSCIYAAKLLTSHGHGKELRNTGSSFPRYEIVILTIHVYSNYTLLFLVVFSLTL